MGIELTHKRDKLDEKIVEYRINLNIKITWGSLSLRLRDPQGLAGTITYPIVHWRAFLLYSLLYQRSICISCIYFYSSI